MSPAPKSGSKTGTKAGAKPRRAQRRRRSVLTVRDASWRDLLRDLAERTNLLWAVTVAVVFVVLVSGIAAWAHERPLVAVGQVMTETRTVRVAFTRANPIETENKREEERQRTPRRYTADNAAIEEIRASVERLPTSIAGVTGVDEVNEEIRRRFGFSDERLAALQQATEDESGQQTWTAAAASLGEILRRRPLMDRVTFQGATQDGLSPQIELDFGDSRLFASRNDAINLDDPDRLAQEIRTIVRVAGFSGPAAELVHERLIRDPRRPTFLFDASGTAVAQQDAADAVEEEVTAVPRGQKIFDRGDLLDRAQYDLYVRELSEFRRQADGASVWLRRLAVAGAVATLTIILAGYLSAFSPTIAGRAARITWLSVVLFAAVVAASIAGASDPRFLVLSVLTPVVLVTILFGVAYDQRTALGVGTGLAAIIVVVMDLPFSIFLLAMIGLAAAVAQLGDLRQRRAIVRLSLVVAAVQFGAAWIAGFADRPLAGGALGDTFAQTTGDAVQAGLAGLLAGGITLFVLPSIERAFDIATGMTLIELRDPKQPLLREMQQRAPGTYNHSLNVASIAESAADAIGADGLMTYVGCLYHDIGKINKPEYFVENQAGGLNKHDKLSPAMSLLVIVGHVKDGLEMAREHNLPRNLRHFIEAHHGTTLVEYFYKRAKQKAEASADHDGPDADEERLPEEIDYRYPGPRPRTKEVAILMLADAVESTTRTLAEPTPSRIDALVRDLANRRLMDGQFDDCDLTLRELHTISDSLSKSVASIYHGRISYSGEAKKPAETAEPKPGRSVGEDPAGGAKERRA